MLTGDRGEPARYIGGDGAPMPFNVGHRAGRIIEVTIEGQVSLSEVRLFHTLLQAVLGRITEEHGLAVSWADLRRADAFPPDVAAQILALLIQDNPRLERCAYIVGGNENVAFVAQLEQLVVEAASTRGWHPTRQTFRDPLAGAAWLKETLSEPLERARIDALAAG